MGIPGQSVDDENSIAAVGIECTGGFKSYIHFLEFSAALQIKGEWQAEILGSCDQCILSIYFSVSSCLVY